MRVSSNRLAVGHDGLRASDAERDEAIGELRHRFTEGRLSQETFIYRMDAALRAKGRSELSELFADLPAGDLARRDRPDRATRLAESFRRIVSTVRGLASADRTSGASNHKALRSRPRPHGDAWTWRAEPLPLWLPRQEGRGFTIGRAPSCDFTVSDLSVSRWHARLKKEEETWVLCDLGSTNGTRLNGWRVTENVPVRPGDQVSFGSITYVVTDHPAA